MAFKDLSKEQQGNFVKLQKYMIAIYGSVRFHDNFDMEAYQSSEESQDELDIDKAFTEHTCGTCACLVGHGPMAGIPWGSCTSWSKYSLNSFGISPWGSSSTEWSFLFEGLWSDDIQEAIARLTMFIGGFDPKVEDWNYTDRYTL